MKKILILDGNSLIYRAFYALPLLTNKEGFFTNAAYGFTTMLFKILKEEATDYIAIAFDTGKTFRHEQFADYKGTRKKMPPELAPQFNMVKKILDALNIKSIGLEGYEADDLIGTIAKRAEKEEIEVTIVTGDRDALQLISDNIKVFLTRKGISEIDKYNVETIWEKYNLKPLQLVDVKGLMGDNSDNIPGVPGIGEKTALKLIQEYGDLKNIYEHVDALGKPKMIEKLKEFKDQAFLSKDLGKIECNAPFEIYWDEYRYEKPNYEPLLAIFKELEFNSLLKDILSQMKDQNTDQEDYHEQDDDNIIVASIAGDALEEAEKVVELLKDVTAEIGCFYTMDKENHLDASFSQLCLSWNEQVLLIDVLDDQGREGIKTIFSVLKEKKVFFHDLKKILVLSNKYGLKECPSSWGDTMLAAYLLNPSASNYELENLSLEYLSKPIVPSDNQQRNAIMYSKAILDLARIFMKELQEMDMYNLYCTLELPLEEILAQMEIKGFKLDIDILKTMGKDLDGQIKTLTQEIYNLAGDKFNINSPKQLAVILFEKLGLPPLKKTKTGYSTNAEVLEILAEKHEIVAKIIEYRQLVKLKSTYIDGFLSLLNPITHKVHTTFNQTITATGRLSSTEPNLQNIPIRLEVGRKIREVFIPNDEEHILISADYSQIELRVLAHMADDPNLIEAFNNDEDIHTRTASEVFSVKMEDVTSEMRRRAKAVNFGIVYGISDFGLSRDLGITRKESKEYIDIYFSRYPSVKNYLDRVILEAKENGYVSTILNRRRYIPEVYNSNKNIRSFGERAAMNSPIQGSAADIIKLAMLKVQEEIERNDLKIDLLLQVHDELVFNVPKIQTEQALQIIHDAMENAFELKVKLKVDIKTGSNWYDMKKV